MPNTIKTISLTDDDKSYLNKLLTQSTLEIRVYQCARILLLKSEGASNEAIADKLDIGIGVVKRCLNKFKENSVEASLHDNNGRGRKAEITDDDITWVISKACQKPKDYGLSPIRNVRRNSKITFLCVSYTISSTDFPVISRPASAYANKPFFGDNSALS